MRSSDRSKLLIIFMQLSATMISCDARPPKLWFSLLTFVTYLRQMDLNPGPGTRVIAAGY